MKKRTIKYVLINHLLVNPGYMCLGFYLAGPRMRFEGFPTHGEIIKFFIVALVADDFIFMILHRIFHEVPFLYKFHKVHHEYESVISPMALYAHPVEQIFANLVDEC
jgi:sterol desaturase/sphingolipid hydroxylase (fatty acid hydroxylase superfamily)